MTDHAIREIAALLTPRQWDVWILRTGACQTFQQIARTLDITPQTAHTHYETATRRIQQHLARQQEDNQP